MDSISLPGIRAWLTFYAGMTVVGSTQFPNHRSACTHMHVHMHTCTHVHTHTHTHTHTCTHTHTHTHTHVHTHTHTHTQYLGKYIPSCACSLSRILTGSSCPSLVNEVPTFLVSLVGWFFTVHLLRLAHLVWDNGKFMLLSVIIYILNNVVQPARGWW